MCVADIRRKNVCRGAVLSRGCGMYLESGAVNRGWLSLIAHGPVSNQGGSWIRDIYGWRNDSVRLVTRRSLCRVHHATHLNVRRSAITLVRSLIVAVARNEGRTKCVRTHVAWAAFCLLRPIQQSYSKAAASLQARHAIIHGHSMCTGGTKTMLSEPL